MVEGGETWQLERGEENVLSFRFFMIYFNCFFSVAFDISGIGRLHILTMLHSRLFRWSSRERVLSYNTDSEALLVGGIEIIEY